MADAKEMGKALREGVGAPAPQMALAESRDKLQGAAQLAQAMLGKRDEIQQVLRPHAQRLELISQELQRTHATIQVKIANRELYQGDSAFLERIRSEFILALIDFKNAAKNFQAKA